MRVLFLNKYTAGGPSSRYRVLQFLPFLETRGIHATVHALHDDGYLAARYAREQTSPFYLARRTLSRLAVLATAPQYDLVFIQKEMFPHLIDVPEWWLSRAGVPYVVDFDDAVHLMYVRSRGPMRAKFARILSRARLVLAGNRYLEQYARAYAEHVVFFPTVVDTDRFTPGHPGDSAGPPRDSAVTVGWMGTPETVKYLEAIVPALDAAARQAAISLLVVGAPAPATRGFAARSKPWSEADEADDLRAMDIGVMPLADDEWSKGKCALKLIQYMSAGVASVSSPRGSAVEFVRDGDNAFLATEAAEWADRVAVLAQSPERRAEMGRRARATVEAQYSLREWGPRFADALEWAAGNAGAITLPWSLRQ